MHVMTLKDINWNRKKVGIFLGYFFSQNHTANRKRAFVGYANKKNKFKTETK